MKKDITRRRRGPLMNLMLSLSSSAPCCLEEASFCTNNLFRDNVSKRITSAVSPGNSAHFLRDTPLCSSLL